MVTAVHDCIKFVTSAELIDNSKRSKIFHIIMVGSENSVLAIDAILLVTDISALDDQHGFLNYRRRFWGNPIGTSINVCDGLCDGINCLAEMFHHRKLHVTPI